MSLQSTILAAVAKAKLAIGDLVEPCHLVQRGEAVVTPGSPPTYPEVIYNVGMTPTSYEALEIDGDRIKASDVKGLIFPEKGVPTPDTNDILRQLDGAGNVVRSFRIMYNDKVMAGSVVALSQVQMRPM